VCQGNLGCRSSHFYAVFLRHFVQQFDKISFELIFDAKFTDVIGKLEFEHY